MTRVMTVVGTRPEIIRLSRVIARLDRTVDPIRRKTQLGQVLALLETHAHLAADALAPRLGRRVEGTLYRADLPLHALPARGIARAENRSGLIEW